MSDLLATFAFPATAGVSDLRWAAYGLLLLFMALACGHLLSSAARAARVLLDLVKDVLRTLLLALLVALLVAGMAVVTFADLIAAS